MAATSSFRPRGLSTPALYPSPRQYPPISRVTSNPPDDRPSSSFRNRSRSPSSYRDRSPGHIISDIGTWKSSRTGTETPPHSQPSTWWNRKELVPRPWRDAPKRKATVPAEQAEGWIRTRARVAEAAVSVLGTAGDVAHETLLVSVDLLRFAPIIGLQEAARTLLTIWDSLQLVDTNRLACLRLTERCADILLSVREEIAEAGDYVGEELHSPITKLVDSFIEVQSFLQMQVHRPFIKRYLKRDEILKQIAVCDALLSDSLGMFSLSIQIRILKQVQASERRRQEDTSALLSSLGLVPQTPKTPPQSRFQALTQSDPTGSLLLSDDLAAQPHPPADPDTDLAPDMGMGLSSLPPSSPPSISFPSSHEPNSNSPTPTTATPSTTSSIHNTLLELHRVQNAHDEAHDMADLRQLMRAALQTSSDAEMIDVLQVGREEMPEAMKTLQRALEKEWERGIAGWGVGVGGAGPGGDEGAGREREKVRRVSITQVQVDALTPRPSDIRLEDVDEERGSVDGDTDGVGGPGILKRSKTVVSIDSFSTGVSASGSGSGSGGSGKDTLDKEFIESGIDALRRMSRGVETNLPSWTITRYEVDRLEKIGVGFFSDVYRGTWGERTVAIKVLAPMTPRATFVREVEIWKGLRHGHVLELFGASGASGDGPWFLVSPYLWRGSVVMYLKGVKAAGNDGEVDLLKMMHEVAKGMEYLHRMGVLHGDLKAANVLVDDRIRCVISDFGQSEMKSEAYRLSGTPLPHGTLRWQAPELMAGQNQLTTEMDVYAYAICCVEILTMGSLPWPLMDDDAVRYFVLRQNSRPPLPAARTNTPQLQDLLRVCWHRDPFVRPTFARVVRDVKQLRINAGARVRVDDTPSPRSGVGAVLEQHVLRPSPDMCPVGLPGESGHVVEEPAAEPSAESPVSSEGSYQTASDVSPPSPVQNVYVPVMTPGHVQTPQPVLYTPSLNSSRASSLFTTTPEDNRSESDVAVNVVDYTGYDSPPPVNERMAELRNERRYRLLLNHDFHPSLTLPLWMPGQVALGAVGYLSKPRGAFVTLFNSFDPPKTSGGLAKGMPSVHGYGRVTQGSQRQDRRNIALRGLDTIVGLLTFRNRGDGDVSQNVSRRYSFPLRSGHRTAYLCTETTMYRYTESLDAPKKWFKANIDAIMHIYGPHHPIQKEDIFLVIGTLDAPDYGLFVSHQHPDGQAHFNVFSSPKAGKSWGMFTTDTEFPSELGGPSYHEEVPGNPLSASKVSVVGRSWDTVLVAKLRFKPDVLEPTSL